MAIGVGSPTVRARRLRAVLRALRTQTGRTATDVAGALGWATTTVIRLEQTSRKPRPGAVEALLNEYGVTDPDERNAILALAEKARARGWWDEHGDVMHETYSTYVGLEAEARALRVFDPLTIPSLLQTPAYTRALLRARHPSRSDDTVDHLVQVVAQRQLRLSGDDEVELWAIIGEAALRLVIGGSDTMIEQLEHLAKLAAQPNIHVQVLPFEAGVPPFTVLRFEHPLDPEIANAETCVGSIWVKDRADLDALAVDFQRLVDACPSVHASAARVRALAADLRR